jgi:virulence-associated protein VapD
MEIIWIIGLVVLAIVLLVLYIRERKAVNSYKQSDDFYERKIKDLKNQVFHHNHHSEMHQKSFNDAENKIKSFGFTGIEDPQLLDPQTIAEMSKVRSAMEEDARARFQKEEKKKRDEELATRARIKELAEIERARLAVISSKEEAVRAAKRYRDQGSYSTDSAGMMSFIPAMGAIAYDGGGGFSGSGGSFGDSGGGDSGGGGGGGGE